MVSAWPTAGQLQTDNSVELVPHDQVNPCLHWWCIAQRMGMPCAFTSMSRRCAAPGEPQEGNRAARRLHMVRRAERGLMSYDR